MTTRAGLLFGTDEPVPEIRLLQAGALSAELLSGNLAKIRWNGHEIIRAVAYLVRDENWGNCTPQIIDLRIDEEPNRFRVTYRAAFIAADGARIDAEPEITGDAAGHLAFSTSALPAADFSTNRCGFCVLHPIAGLAGRTVTVEHVDGRTEAVPLPERIDPAQPLQELRTITHEAVPGLNVACRMEGDTFEMEDQRAWTDASFKTYVRPLALPWPYILKAGQPNRQSVTISISGSAPVLIPPKGVVDIRFGPPAGTLPPLGLAVMPADAEATLAQADRLAELGVRHLTFHFDPRAGDAARTLRNFAAILARHAAEATLEIVLPCERPVVEELVEIARQTREAGFRPDAVVVGPAADMKSTPPGSAWPDCPPLEEIYEAARTAFPNARLGGGMISTFTELNRKRPPLGPLDFVTHSTAAIVHAADDRSVMETLEALPFVTRSVRAIVGDKPYRIGFAAIGMRDNPYGSRLNDNPENHRLTMTDKDPRQKGFFAAAWMVGYAVAVLDAGLELLTLGSLTGPFGVLRPDGTSRPAFVAARMLARLGGRQVRRAEVVEGCGIAAFAAGACVLVANLTDDPRSVRIERATRAERLDENGLDHVTLSSGNELTLGAYGIALVEGDWL